MKTKYLINSKKFTQVVASIFVATIMIYGVYMKHAQGRVVLPKISPITTNGWQNGGLVNTKVTLSQNKVLQNSDGLLYLQIDLEATDDDKNLIKKRVPTDFVVVLDRSGSMSGRNKMTFAHKAIESLLWQVGEKDRFSMVTFDDRVEVPIELTTINKRNRDKFISSIKGVSPRGSTNLGAGLIEGMNILKNSSKKSGHVQRLILISDGMANAGITSTSELSRIAGGALKGEFVVSSIGVGLDFNETLLSSLADHGNGSYYFLENVAKLDKILADEFYGASQILANNIQVRLNLASGFKVEDASGYPIKKRGENVFIQAGHLYKKQKKSFFVTLKVPTKDVYAEALGDVEVSYKIEDKPFNVALVKPDMTIACLPMDKKEEVKKSIDKETFTNAWTRNNYGLFLKEGSGYIGKGDLSNAKKSVSKYRGKLKQAYEMAPSPKLASQITQLDKVEEEMDDAVTGENKDEKQKRLGKKYHFKGGNEQRNSM